ncbi:MAG: UDP-N-acetylmuramoyl-L-alanyl-D-glutamate--2,6-diaminopimelate ligase, partial [Myxococcota bacterium]
RVGPGWIFVACAGATKKSRDGHAFVKQACDKQAAAVLVRPGKRVDKKEKTPVFVVENARLALAQLVEAWYGHPSKQMQVCAVTGTNGKTSVTHLLATILQAAGYQAAVLGTLGVGKLRYLKSTLHTTSTAEDLSAQLAMLHQQGFSHACMEISSHALALKRADGITLALGALTNITQDHLDFHSSMRRYIYAKRRLFAELLAAGQPAVLPINHAFVQQAEQKGLRVITWGQCVQARVRVSCARGDLNGMSLQLHMDDRTFDVKSALWGPLNVDNLLCAAACAWALGVQEHVIAQGLCRAQPLPGRMQMVRIRSSCPLHTPTVLVDYAHTPHALSCLLDAVLHALPKRGRLILVFGCGGERDTVKRPVMGAIAAQKAHVTLLAHDNPRHEDPMVILRDIVLGMQNGCEYHMVGDRAQAIERAIAMAHPEDIVVIAGKGHEKAQQWGDEIRPFCDVTRARRALQKHFGS